MQNAPRAEDGSVAGRRTRLPKSHFVVSIENSTGRKKELILHPTKGWRIK